MKRRQMFEMLAVVALVAGSVAMAGNAVDVNHRADSHRATLTAEANTGPTGFDVDFLNRTTPPLPPPMRQKRGQGFREKNGKPNPVADPAPVCSDNQLLGVMAGLFGYGDVAIRCRDTTNP